MNTNKIQVGKNRKINFDIKLRYTRQKNYNIYKYDLIDANFKDVGDCKLYKNFNLNIFINKYCNADCKFCIAQMRYQNAHAMYKDHGIQDYYEYLTRLDNVLKTIRKYNPSISITGGEPTMSPILTEVLKLVDKYNFRKRTITTNGSGLFKIQDGDFIINNLIKYNWDHLNISRVSYNDILNKKIMRFNEEKSYCSIDMLKHILTIANNSTKLKHRISCLLLKESINSVPEMINYIDFFQKIGANNFIFRELMDYDESAINKEKIDYCNLNKIRLNDIWHDFEKYPDFIPYLNILGYYYYVEIYKYHGLTVASESANLVQQTLEKNNNPDVIYEMVFHDNGNLNASWIDNQEILDKYDKK